MGTKLRSRRGPAGGVSRVAAGLGPPPPSVHPRLRTVRGAHAKGTVMGGVAGDKRSGRCALLRRPPSGLTGLAHSPWEGRGKAD